MVNRKGNSLIDWCSNAPRYVSNNIFYVGCSSLSSALFWSPLDVARALYKTPHALVGIAFPLC